MNVLSVLLCGRLVWNVEKNDFGFEFVVAQMPIVTCQSACRLGAGGNMC